METNGLARRSTQESLRTMHARERQAERAEKTMRLDECPQRLKAALPPWLPWIRQRGGLSRALARQGLAIRPRPMARRGQPRTRTRTRRLDGTTRPGALLKHQIPITTDHGEVHTPGSLESDVVSHAGASAVGECLHTRDGVDLHTGGVERQAVLGKGRHGMVAAVQTREQPGPFPWRGRDADTGSEGINAHRWAFCQRPGGHAIPCTRSRPSTKEDTAQVEQTHWTPGRTLIGGDRDDRAEAWQALNARSADRRIFQSLFQPSMKRVAKLRQGARLIRRDDRPQPPCARVWACPDADPRTRAA